MQLLVDRWTELQLLNGTAWIHGYDMEGGGGEHAPLSIWKDDAVVRLSPMYIIEVARMSQHAGNTKIRGLNWGRVGSSTSERSRIAPPSPDNIRKSIEKWKHKVNWNKGDIKWIIVMMRSSNRTPLLNQLISPSTFPWFHLYFLHAKRRKNTTKHRNSPKNMHRACERLFEKKARICN